MHQYYHNPTRLLRNLTGLNAKRDQNITQALSCKQFYLLLLQKTESFISCKLCLTVNRYLPHAVKLLAQFYWFHTWYSHCRNSPSQHLHSGAAIQEGSIKQNVIITSFFLWHSQRTGEGAGLSSPPLSQSQHSLRFFANVLAQSWSRRIWEPGSIHFASSQKFKKSLHYKWT